MRPKVSTIFQLKIVLSNIRPQIWRQIQVPHDIRLDELHLVLQAAMGWTNSHLHSFSFSGREFTSHHAEDDQDELEMEDESEFRLSELVSTPKAKFNYTYDFGDNWEHIVTLEKVLDSEPLIKYPLCLDGKRACPPEDCGGKWSYPRLVAAMNDPTDPEYKEMRSWVGRTFNPEYYDVTSFAKNLRRLRSTRLKYEGY